MFYNGDCSVDECEREAIDAIGLCKKHKSNTRELESKASHADKLAEEAKTLAMLALQSERYTQDADYRSVTDNTLARVAAYEAAQ